MTTIDYETNIRSIYGLFFFEKEGLLLLAEKLRFLILPDFCLSHHFKKLQTLHFTSRSLSFLVLCAK